MSCLSHRTHKQPEKIGEKLRISRRCERTHTPLCEDVNDGYLARTQNKLMLDMGTGEEERLRASLGKC